MSALPSQPSVSGTWSNRLIPADQNPGSTLIGYCPGLMASPLTSVFTCTWPPCPPFRGVLVIDVSACQTQQWWWRPRAAQIKQPQGSTHSGQFSRGRVHWLPRNTVILPFPGNASLETQALSTGVKLPCKGPHQFIFPAPQASMKGQSQQSGGGLQEVWLCWGAFGAQRSREPARTYSLNPV